MTLNLYPGAEICFFIFEYDNLWHGRNFFKISNNIIIIIYLLIIYWQVINYVVILDILLCHIRYFNPGTLPG